MELNSFLKDFNPKLSQTAKKCRVEKLEHSISSSLNVAERSGPELGCQIFYHFCCCGWIFFFQVLHFLFKIKISTLLMKF